MNKYELIRKIEEFAPLETAEKWDCSGFCVETCKEEIKKVMLALTVCDDVVSQAIEKSCDMIVSHHPLFYVPLSYKDIDIYSAHTNMDLAKGGTTDVLVDRLGFSENISADGFLRYVNVEIGLQDLCEKLKRISPHFRYVNNKNAKHFSKIAFCAGSGTEFINEAYENGADAFVSGDLKFHTAVDSPIAVFDIGHFESEILILDTFKTFFDSDVEVVVAEEYSPFRYY